MKTTEFLNYLDKALPLISEPETTKYDNDIEMISGLPFARKGGTLDNVLARKALSKKSFRTTITLGSHDSKALIEMFRLQNFELDRPIVVDVLSNNGTFAVVTFTQYVSDAPKPEQRGFFKRVKPKPYQNTEVPC